MDYILKYVVLLLATILAMAVAILVLLSGTEITFSGALHAAIVVYFMHLILKARDIIQATLDIENEQEKDQEK